MEMKICQALNHFLRASWSLWPSANWPKLQSEIQGKAKKGKFLK